MIRIASLLCLTTALLFNSSCSEDFIACTEEFAMVGIEINGANIIETFTIRNANGDTIRNEGNFNNVFIVLDDGFQKELENREETFTFFAFDADSLRVSQEYVIGADRCHIERISGPVEINL